MLARALYRQPRILFLDEGTAHLDVDNEKRINESLRSLQMTRISVAHRPQASDGADQILRIAKSLMCEVQGPGQHTLADQRDKDGSHPFIQLREPVFPADG
jgi:ATP-binding cassette subfamily B protein RaxB